MAVVQSPLLDDVADDGGETEFIPRLAQDAGEFILRPTRGAPVGDVATLTEKSMLAPMAVRCPSQVLPVLPFVAQAWDPLRPSSARVGGPNTDAPHTLSM